MKLGRNRKVKIALMSLLAVFTFLATVTSTVSWFHHGTNVSFNGNDADFNIDAGAEASYYGGGTGAPGDPYIISNKLHLYNLAWLQYLGTYNKNSIRQLYFKVTNDIDMDGITLPPIGTDLYPFLGHFDGQGHVISNLTISNDNPSESTSDVGVMKPSALQLAGSTQSEVIGFFGVVGKLPTQNISYDTSIVSVANFTISNVNVVSKTSKTLIGLAAGYVDGSISGVKVGGDSSLTVNGQTAVSNSITSKLSDYGLVGYAANKGAGGEYKQTISKYYDSTDDTTGGGENWGGSLDMLSLYNRLTAMEEEVSNVTVPYVYDECYLDGELEGRRSVTNATYRRYSQNTGSNFAGNFNFTSAEDNKVYLVGGHYVNKINYTSIDEQGYYITDGEGHYLTYNGSALTSSTSDDATIWLFDSTSGTTRIYTTLYNSTTYALSTVYLRSNSNSLTTTTTQNSATTWTLDKNGVNLSIIYNNYHLVYRNNGWTLLANGRDDPTRNVDNPDFYVLGNTNSSYFIASPTGSTTVSRTNAFGSAAQLILDGSNHVYADYNGTSYYLMLYRTSNRNYSLRWQSETGTSNYYFFTYDSGNSRFTATASGTTYYISYRSSNFTAYTSSYAVSFTPCAYGQFYKLSNTLDSAAVHRTGRSLGPSDGYMEFSSEDTTYFPINAYSEDQVDELGNTTSKQYEPIATNTGYVVAGTTKSTYASANRSMVVSNYPKDRVLYHSLNENSELVNIRTINQNGIVALDESNLHKYNDYEDENGETVLGSKSKFQNVVTGSSTIGGLHFVNKDTSPVFAIGKNNVVAATNVKVNGATYDGNKTYDLPVYTIDFNLKKQGYINFFAGTYNGGYSKPSERDPDPDLNAGTTGNGNINAFFSLHRVIRKSNDKTAIEDIKEIKGIYSSANSVNYTYSYKKYSTGNNYTVVDESGNAFNDSGLTLLFDTDWIGYRSNRKLQDNNDVDPNNPEKGTLGSIFYFEIPVDSGEYCLGNVRNSIDSNVIEGCYLMYLDIGANGNEASDHISGYCVTTYVDPVSFPTGVDFAIEALTNSGLGGETLCIFIDPSSSGTVTFSLGKETVEGTPKDKIAIDDSSGISQFSYLSQNANSGFLIRGENLPADYEDPPDSDFIVTRVSYMAVEKPNGSIYLITVADELNENGVAVSTVYHLTYTNDQGEVVSSDLTLAEIQAIVPAAEDYFINSIRQMITIVTLERLSATSVSFNAQLPELPWTNASNTYIISLNVPSGYTIKVSVTNSANYTVYINSETALVFTNNTVNYVEP